MPALLHGHPDDWWNGHNWEHWWPRLTSGERARLLELGWGDEPAPLPGMGIVLTSLRGAVHETTENYLTNDAWAERRTRTVRRATDEFLTWLEEKRAEPDHPQA